MFLFVLCSYPPFVFFTGFLWLPPIFTDHLLFFQSMCDTLSLAFLMFNVNWHNIILSSYLHMKSIWSKVFFTISPGCLLLITESSNWNNSVRKSCLKFSSETNFLRKRYSLAKFWTNKIYVSKQKIRHFCIFDKASIKD